MNFSDFKRMLDTDPNNADPEFRRARDLGPEFRQAAAESARFEERLGRAVRLPSPGDLVSSLQGLAAADTPRTTSWRPLALAAGLALAVALVLFFNRPQPMGRWDSMQDYLAAHYAFDGPKLLEMAEAGADGGTIHQMLADYGLQISPQLAGSVLAVKICDTPHGTGVHFVFDSGTGPVTVFVMPRTQVTDREAIDFDGMQAVLVALPRGSAAAIGTPEQLVAGYHDLLQNALVPLTG